jgi:hypothetical protein
MKRSRPYSGTRIRREALALIFPFLAAFGCSPSRPDDAAQPVHRRPDIFPLSHGTVIPPNIAPLNFVVRENGDAFFVLLKPADGKALEVSSRSPRISLPRGPWREMLARNRGKTIDVEIYCRADKTWRRFDAVRDTVAPDGLDPFVAYRKIPLCKDWYAMGMYQRDVRDFNERIVFENRSTTACLNCHSFLNNAPDRMAIQVRSKSFGTPMVLGGTEGGRFGLRAVNTATAFSSGKVGLTSWHPGGNLVAFTMNRFEMTFLTAGTEPRQVFDAAADIALYDNASNEISTCPALSRKDRIETMPEWSRDGRSLYFCSAPQLPESQYRSLACDLMRIAFDPKTGAWGAVDTVLTAVRAGGSVLQPRTSPDGRFILVNVSPYGDFPVDKDGTRLALLNLQTGSFAVYDSELAWTDSWHGWSSNGRWIVFSSKRLNGRFSCVCFAYADSAGGLHRPIALPQKDPSFYESSVFAYNVPECLTARIPVAIAQFAKALQNYGKKSSKDAVTAASARAGEYEEYSGGLR